MKMRCDCDDDSQVTGISRRVPQLIITRPDRSLVIKQGLSTGGGGGGTLQPPYFSAEIDLTAANLSIAITPPAGWRLFPDQFGLYLTQYADYLVPQTLVQPFVSLGIVGNAVKYKGPLKTTFLTAALLREFWTVLAADNAETAFQVQVPTPASGVQTLKGKFWVGGLLIPA
jgi:hypothetical protein